MYRLPLFPLPVVLFPGGRMPLHIFEPRYRRMVARCLEYDRRFGLIYHDADVSGPFLTEPGRVGTVAAIDTFRPLPDGRSLILTRGEDRFRIHDGVEVDTPYYEAVVETYVDARPRPRPALVNRRRDSLALFDAVLELLPEPPDRVPETDVEEELSFALARTLEIDPEWQQELLELRDEVRRLDRLDAVFQAAIDQGAVGGC